MRFWMQLLGGTSAKRTLVMSNMETIGGLDLGKLTKPMREKKTKVKTASI